MSGKASFRTPPSLHRSAAGFSLAEAVIAMGISVIAMSGALQVNSQHLHIVKSVRESSAASQTLEERVEQLRIATWQQVTSAPYLTGTFFATKPKSVAPLSNYRERVTVSAWPIVTGGAKLVVDKPENAAAVVVENVGAVATERLAKVDVRITWIGMGKRQRVRELSTILSNGGISRMNLPAMGAAAGSPSTGPTSTPDPSATPAPSSTPNPSATPTPAPSRFGRGNIAGRTGKS